MYNTIPTLEQEYLLKFFTETVDTKTMAQSLRRATYLIALSYIRAEETVNPMNKEWTDDSFYFLNELAEVLDPVLESR
mgnify:FL=1